MMSVALSTFLYVASGFSDANEAFSMLQLKANASRTGTESSFAFGCTGKGKAAKVLKCGLWGDPHLHCRFNQACAPGKSYGPPINEVGWHGLARSLDGSFELQGYMDKPPGPSSIIALAGKFGQTRFEMIKFKSEKKNKYNVHDWWEYWSVNGERVDPSKPKTFDDGTFIKRVAERIYHLVSNEGDPAGACIESPDSKIALKAAAYMWSGLLPASFPINLELQMDSVLADTNWGICNQQSTPLKEEELLVSKEGQDQTCKIRQMAGSCMNPPPPPPTEPTPDEVCEEKHLNIARGKKVCADEKDKSDDMFKSCLFDWCSSGGSDDSAKGAEEFDEIDDPMPECQINDKECHHCKACKTSVDVDLSTVTSNNLGGQGPKTGAEEIRYQKAIKLDGKTVDVVLTVDGEFSLDDSSRNGVSNQFGQLALTCGSSADFKFSFVDSQTGVPVEMDDMALTFYDLDQGKRGSGKESVSVCDPDEVFAMTNSELESSKAGSCHRYSATVKGTKKDNPTDPKDLSAEQLAKAVTYTFSGKNSVEWSASIGGGCKGKVKQRDRKSVV